MYNKDITYHLAMSAIVLYFGLSCGIVQVFGCSGGDTSETPKFINIPCKSINQSSDGKLCFDVTYPDTDKDVLVVSSVRGENAVYEGKLLKEQTTASVVLGDSSQGLKNVEVNNRLIKYCY